MNSVQPPGAVYYLSNDSVERKQLEGKRKKKAGVDQKYIVSEPVKGVKKVVKLKKPKANSEEEEVAPVAIA